MHHLNSFSSQTPLTARSCSNSIISNKTAISSSSSIDATNHGIFCKVCRKQPLFMPKKRSKNHHQWRISAVERDQSKFEVDQDKARKALSELDQQIESLSTKQPNSPKIKASSIGNLAEQAKNEPPEITGSFLRYTAFFLFLFTILYNVLFVTVIKPSVDGPDEDVADTDVTTTYQAPNNAS
ncbi:uncharacterized protein LOC130796790 isoform X1 [Amaranthus tricolor]|uniref:uncharacterized protein LOC130796790 isoform X1 n=2 Tax=Amaranthus tricolor TaxID=29722 RepID=UPI00258A216A|nr:uncharacterized protein LOC130796790 isoform X1 [Amaranthus tricolor]